MEPLKTTAWHTLPLKTRILHCPPLLVKTALTVAAYTIHITDLSHLWTTTLPLNTHGELVTILTLLLSPPLPPPPESAQLSLTSTPDSRLRLSLNEWSFTLRLESALSFTNEVVLPLAAAAALGAKKVKSLQDALAGKDAVIERLADAADSGKVPAKVLVGQRRRKALAPFNVERWEAGFKGEMTAGEVVAEGLGGEAVVAPIRVEGWWKAICDETEREDEMRAVATEVVGEGKVGDGHEIKDRETHAHDNLTLEPQSTEPAAPPRPESAIPNVINDPEDIDLDLDAGVPRSPSPPQLPPVKRMIGKIGGRKPPAAEPVAASPPSPPPPPPSASLSLSPAQSPAPRPVRRIIGRIGGGVRSAAAASSPAPSTQPQEAKAEPEEELTEEEKADRKRQQLQRELEAKKKNPPRKKRKF